jgi:hypothetical protein
MFKKLLFSSKKGDNGSKSLSGEQAGSFNGVLEVSIEDERTVKSRLIGKCFREDLVTSRRTRRRGVVLQQRSTA